MEDRLIALINKNGVRKTTEQLQVNTFHLLEDIVKYENAKKIFDKELPLLKKCRENIIISISNVYLTMEQLRLHYRISKNQIKKVIDIDNQKRKPEIYQDLARLNMAIIEYEMIREIYYQSTPFLATYKSVLIVNLADVYLALRNVLNGYEMKYQDLTLAFRMNLIREEQYCDRI